MEPKSIKKSTVSQLHALVAYMEENPDFARRRVVFGLSKMSVEGLWKNLNSVGSPIRSVAKWKKSWADLKSRTKKKIAESKRSLKETGGGLFRMNPLNELEQVVDQILFLSKATAPSGNVFGFSNITETMDDGFVALKSTPPRTSKTVAVVTPSRQKETPSRHETSSQREIEAKQFLHHQDKNDFPEAIKYAEFATPPRRKEISSNQEKPIQQQQQQKRQLDTRDEPSISSFSKKRKTVADEQLSLIRLQLKVSEQSAALSKDLVDVAKTSVKATKSLAAAANRMRDAAEQQLKASLRIAETFKQFVNFLTEK